MDKMKAVIAKYAEGELLDIATGRGEFMRYLFDSAPQIERGIGVDISEENLRKAREALNLNHAQFETMAGEKLRFEDESFGTVSLSLSLHHVDNPEAVIAEARRVLKLGGCFILFEMYNNDQSEKQMTHVLLHHWWADIDRELGTPHNHTFTDKQILAYIHKFPWQQIETVFVDGGDEPFDEKSTIGELRSICDRYDEKVAKISNGVRAEFLRTIGEGLRKRLETVGMNWCKALCVVARK